MNENEKMNDGCSFPITTASLSIDNSRALKEPSRLLRDRLQFITSTTLLIQQNNNDRQSGEAREYIGILLQIYYQ
jgi:hypothetical protein